MNLGGKIAVVAAKGRVVLRLPIGALEVIATNLALGTILKLDATAAVVVDRVPIGLVVDAIPIAVNCVAPKTEATASMAIAGIVAEDIAIPARNQPRRFGIVAPRTLIIFDDVAGTALFHLNTFIALSVEIVVMDMIEATLIGLIGRVFAIIPLITRRSDIDAFTIFSTLTKDKVIKAAVQNRVMMDVGSLDKIA